MMHGQKSIKLELTMFYNIVFSIYKSPSTQKVNKFFDAKKEPQNETSGPEAGFLNISCPI